MASVFREVVIDCEDPGGLARFWGEVLGWEPQQRGSFWWMSEAGPGPMFCFNEGGGTKQVKNRVHFDVCPKGNEFCVLGHRID